MAASVLPPFRPRLSAAATLLGKDGAFQPKELSTKLKVTGCDLFSAGDFAEADGRDDIVLRDPSRGVYRRVVLEGDRVVKIVEKPGQPESHWAVTGVYLYDGRVFEAIRTLKPSGRGELEITDVNNAYIAEGQMGYDVLKGWWSDAGTFESLARANRFVLGEES